MSAESTFQGLPAWAKGILAVSGLAIIAFIGYKIYSAVQERLKHAGDFAEKTDVKNELETLAKQNIKPSFSNSQYDAWANQLFVAMDGYGSNVSVIYKVFVNTKNNADVLKLIDAYGIRELSSGSYNPAANFKGTLSGAIADELNPKEISALNNILAGRKITIRF